MDQSVRFKKSYVHIMAEREREKEPKVSKKDYEKHSRARREQIFESQ